MLETVDEMKVINLLKTGKNASSSGMSDEQLDYMRQFRAISALEGNATTRKHHEMLQDLSSGKLSKADYIKARLKPLG